MPYLQAHSALILGRFEGSSGRKRRETGVERGIPRARYVSSEDAHDVLLL